MDGVEDIVTELRSIEERLRDRAFEALRTAAEDGDAGAAADEKKLLQARRAVERAIKALAGDSDTGGF
ncbi:MAG TPA: hypothetical protein VFC99_06560 [Acidimicrobiia bacterium]|nr:hypothetical protein [Acidimicrobiia bacterium]